MKYLILISLIAYINFLINISIEVINYDLRYHTKKCNPGYKKGGKKNGR